MAIVLLALALAVGDPLSADSTASRPLVITAGGVYQGHWVSRGRKPALHIRTTEPVTIRDSVVENLGDGTLIHSEIGLGTNVTLERVTARGGVGRLFVGEAIASLTIKNSTIIGTGGIYVLRAQPHATILITRNTQRNIQPGPELRQFIQFNDVTTATIEVSWNEIVNAFGQSRVEDNISLYASAHAQIHDNYIQGAYPSRSAGAFSGSGIMIEAGAYDNEVFRNQIVETTNAGIGIGGGWNNSVYNNRLIFDGRLRSGRRLIAANVGIYVWNAHEDPRWANNQAFANLVGWVNADGVRNDWWLPSCSGNCSNRPLSKPPSYQREQAEYHVWRRKLVANAISVGA